MSAEGYDVIIVGGGTAGLVLANRLSDMEKLTVLVLEAGFNRNDDPKISIPGFIGQNLGDPNYDWCFKTVPQKALGGRVVEQPRGKMLGGSSAINAMAAIYPSHRVFDVWASYGNKGWDANTMGPYMKKWERGHVPSEKTIKELGIGSYLDLSLLGTNGPISTSLPKWHTPMTQTWMKSMDNLGLKSKKDFVSGEPLGAGINRCFIDPTTGTRSHAGNAYWEPVKSRTNLTLQEGATVDKVVLERDDKGVLVAKAVQYSVDGVKHIVRAEKEIILSAGAFGSPAILEMSGVGNPQILKPLGIGVILENKNVGENLQDHPMAMISHEVSDPEITLDSLKLPGKFDAAMKLYMEEKDGPLANAFTLSAFLSTLPFMDSSDTQTFLALVDNSSPENTLAPSEKIRIEYFKSVARSEKEPICSINPAPFAGKGGYGSKDFMGITLVFSLLCPCSRGSTHIVSTDPTKNPAIDPGYLTHPVDVEIFARHMLFTKTLFTTEPFKSLLTPGGGTNVPASMSGPSGLPETMDQAKAFAKEVTGTQFHPVGSCSMMPEELGGVVDDRLRVHGVKGLRVCDASIFPVLPKGPMTTSVYAVAERAADIIKEDLKNSGV